MTGNHEINPLRSSDPEQLGDYRLVGRLGRGGMGTVYLAESQSGERAAVKVINPDLADDDTFRERFRREVESARRVRRFCTAPVLDAKLDGEPLFIVTEFVDGPNLDEFVSTSGPMRGSSLEHLAVGVATALTTIHGAGVVHRDLKPANVLLSSVGPRVIDFGIARALDTLSGATRTGQFIGTPAYMAPELISGGKASPASDVFAWGCVVTFAGTGRVPFDAPSIPSVLYQISHGEPSIDGLDEDLRHLVERTLDKDPAKRPSAQELLDQLTGRSNTDTATAAQDVGRTWAIPTGSTTVPDTPPTHVATSVFGPPSMGGTPPTHVGAPPYGGPPAKGRRNRTPWMLAAAGLAVVVLAAVGVLLLHGSSGPPSKVTTAFSDDFHDNGSGWSGSTFTSDNGYYQGGYRIDADGDYNRTETQAAPYKGAIPTRALISVDTWALGGPPYGMVGAFCRASDDSSSNTSEYEFLVRHDGQGAVIRKVAGGNGSRELVHPTSVPGFKKNGKNHLQVECEQQGTKVHLQLWVNGNSVAETTDGDKPLANGAVGLETVLENKGSGGDMQGMFDNFQLCQIDS